MTRTNGPTGSIGLARATVTSETKLERPGTNFPVDAAFDFDFAYSFSLNALRTPPAKRRAEASLAVVEGADSTSVTARRASLVASP